MGAISRVPRRPGVVADPGMCGRSLHGNREAPRPIRPCADLVRRRRMHQPIPQQGQWLKQVVTGYFNYHAVPTNAPRLAAFHFHVTHLWWRTLRRRSQKDWTTMERIVRLVEDWLPKPRILHPWPDARFAVRHPRWEPYARIGHYGSERGARGNPRPYRDHAAIAAGVSIPREGLRISAVHICRTARPFRLKPFPVLML